MLEIIKKIVLILITALIGVIIVGSLAIINITMYLFSGGKTYGDFESDVCKQYLSYNFDTELVDEKEPINCHIEDLFPSFLAQYEFEYKAKAGFVTKIENFGFKKKDFCEENLKKQQNTICYTNVYKQSSQIIKIDKKKLYVYHRINF